MIHKFNYQFSMGIILTVIPSLQLTWHLKNDGWKTTFLLGWPIFRGFLVSFRGCNMLGFPKNSPKRMEVVILFVVTSFNSHSLRLRGRAKIQGVPKNDVESTWSKVATGKNAIKGVAIRILLMATRNPAFTS